MRQHPSVSGSRNPPRRLCALRQGEAGEAGLPRRQSVLHQALWLLRRSSMPSLDDQGCCSGVASGLAHGQGVREAVHAGAAPTSRDADRKWSASTRSRSGRGTPTGVVSDLVRGRPIWFGARIAPRRAWTSSSSGWGPGKARVFEWLSPSCPVSLTSRWSECVERHARASGSMTPPSIETTRANESRRTCSRKTYPSSRLHLRRERIPKRIPFQISKLPHAEKLATPVVRQLTPPLARKCRIATHRVLRRSRRDVREPSKAALDTQSFCSRSRWGEEGSGRDGGSPEDDRSFAHWWRCGRCRVQGSAAWRASGRLAAAAARGVTRGGTMQRWHRAMALRERTATR